MNKKYIKTKYLLLGTLYILISLFTLSINKYSNTSSPLIFGILLLVVWSIYYVIRVIWFKTNFELLKKYIWILLIEDLCISGGLILVFFLEKNNILQGEFLSILIYLPFFIPSIIFDSKYEKIIK